MKAPVLVYKLNEQVYFMLRDLKGYAKSIYNKGDRCTYKIGYQYDTGSIYYTSEKSFTIKDNKK